MPGRIRILVLVLIWLMASACACSQTWTLAWSDEFNGTAGSPIDPNNWQFDTGILNVNDEVEYYCAPSTTTSPCNPANPNAYIDGNGHLVIQAIEINSSTAPYSGSWTSARLNTGNNLQSFSYGRLESSMSLPIGPGLWPAYWALGTNINSVGWPSCGEIDFMENVPASSGLGPTEIRSTIHGGLSSTNCYCGANGLGQSYTFPANDPNGPDVTTFHAYGGIWSSNMVQFYVDDPTNVFFVRTASDVPAGQPWEFNHPFFLLLNLAVGGTGSWPGPPNNTTPNPAVMKVDYARWYTASAIAGPTMASPAISVAAGATGTTTVSLTSTAGSGRVYLACSTNAPGATCAINSSDPLNQYTVNFATSATATATVSVTTAANKTAAAVSSNTIFPHTISSSKWIGFGAFNLAFLFAIALIPSSRRRNRRAIGAIGILLILALMAACGGSSLSGSITPPPNYTVTVSAYTVSNTAGTPDSTLTIPLTIN
jgi:beta-glucanase (GH16 family)